MKQKREYKPYQGRRPMAGWKKWLIALLALMAAGILAFAALLGVVLAGSHTDLHGGPSIMIILGCQVRADGPSVLLQDRLDTALDYLEDHPDMTVIASGGQGPDEHISEAEAMADYLVEHGFPEGQILLEDESHNTSQNLMYTRELLEESGLDWQGNLLVVSNGFHLARVRMLAQRYGLGEISTLAAPSSHIPSRLMMYIREPLALVKSFLFD